MWFTPRFSHALNSSNEVDLSFSVNDVDVTGIIGFYVLVNWPYKPGSVCNVLFLISSNGRLHVVSNPPLREELRLNKVSRLHLKMDACEHPPAQATEK